MCSKTIESAIFINFINKYQQYKLLASQLNLEGFLLDKRKENEAKIMNTTIKLKSIWHAIFQSPSPLVQKSMKHMNAYENNDSNEYRQRREKNNESVRKSRAKNRVKVQECAKVVAELKMENSQLNNKLSGLQSELITLKNLFQHCFSADLSKLSIKPSEIPTSTLYKIVMNKKQVPSILGSQLKNIELCKNKSEFNLDLNETDNFYVNHIKKALASIEETNSSSSSSSSSSIQKKPSVVILPKYNQDSISIKQIGL